MKLAVGLTNSFEAAADVVATAAISWEFYRNKGHVQSTNSLLDKLLGFAVGRGALVTIVQLLTLALYISNPTSLIWMPVHFSIVAHHYGYDSQLSASSAPCQPGICWE
ncbi:hypothetical protein C8F04DRAFT_710928 [Mycena alexandri]|uniref:DUF6534 domain-containing protein n=1 Tax=Mycena alexandri TaxID=1745969 RepID=A0AAD6SSH4_9AGAR|nr:hypothetical protein C8F04DRAFT_710928 [Mycena alexandri]